MGSLLPDLNTNIMRGRTMASKDGEIRKIKDQWAREAEKEERKIVRKAAIGKYCRKGWAAGIVMVAGFTVRRGRSDIVKAVMQEACLELAGCKEAGLSDFDLQAIRNIF
jgi:hypothetical protein